MDLLCTKTKNPFLSLEGNKRFEAVLEQKIDFLQCTKQ